MSDRFPKIYLARHGETEWSRTGRHTGRADIALTANGEQEARRLGDRLQGMDFRTVLTSPLQRARRTCELAGWGAAVENVPDLMEWHYGQYESRKSVEIQAERPGWLLFRDGCPGGETPDQISARADRVVTRLRTLTEDAIIFSHQDFLRVLAARWLELPVLQAQRFVLSTGSLSALGYNHSLAEPVIRLWNEGGK